MAAMSCVQHRRKGQSMPLYEHVFLARQDVTQAQVEGLMKEYSDLIAAGGGKVTKTEYWGLKNLAFKIRKSRKAHYALFNIDAPHKAVAEMERLMGISTDVIRFMTVKVEEHETEPSVAMRKPDREDRGDRGDRGFGGGGGGRGGDRGGFRGAGGGGGGFRGGDRAGAGAGGGGGGAGGFRSGGGGGFRAREGGDAAGAPAGDRPPRAPRPPRDDAGSNSGSQE
jgi:small subunit ribosomal protein S6